MTRFILLIFALIGFTGVHARAVPSGAPQSIRLYGYGPSGGSRATVRVEDKQTRDPLIGATVSIVSRADTLRGTTVKEAFYNVSAIYTCDRIFRDSVDLEVTYIGYKPYRKRFAPTEFRGRIDVRMEVDEQSIAQVVVVGKRVAMVFKGDTTVYDAGAFRTLADDRLGELLKQLPGIEIKENRIFADGQEVKRVLIDGRNLFGSQTGHALTDLEASDVKNVRVYEDLSVKDRQMGNTTAEKEKVMDVETKSKRGVIQGGSLEGTVGLSLEEDYSGRHEIRHAEAGTYYRNSEKGNWRIEASNSKDDGQKENASFSSKITPSKQTEARVEYTFRRGDTTSVATFAGFSRSRQSSVSRSETEYFPNKEYTLRDEQSTSENLSRSLRANVSNMINILRKKRGFFSSADFSFDNGSAAGRSRTVRQIDEETTRTHLDNDSDNRNLSFNVNLNYYMALSERSRLNFYVTGQYGDRSREGWRVDTLASTPGLQMKLRDEGSGLQYGFTASLYYNYKLGEKGNFTASYQFNRSYDRSKQLAVDFIDDPRGVLDPVNSFSYTNDGHSHNLSTSVRYRYDDLWFVASLNGMIHRVARDEKFPEPRRFPRTFFQLSPAVNLTAGKPKRRFTLNIVSFPQMLSLESLRSTLDATNPLALRAGNPDLKMPNNLGGSAHLSFSDARKALNWGFGFNADYRLNYITTRRTLFLEDTYLPQYDYTAQKGAELTSQINVSGCYSLGGSFNYSQQITSLRSTLSARVNYGFSRTPYYLDEELDYQTRHSLRIGLGFDSGFSSKVRIAVHSATTMGSNTSQQTRRQDLREQLTGSVELRLGKYFGSVRTLYEFYCNSQSHTLTRHNVILNAAAGRKFGKADRLSCSVGVIDILNRPDYATTRFETDYIVTSSTSYLGRYGYLRVAYTF